MTLICIYVYIYILLYIYTLILHYLLDHKTGMTCLGLLLRRPVQGYFPYATLYSNIHIKLEM